MMEGRCNRLWIASNQSLVLEESTLTLCSLSAIFLLTYSTFKFQTGIAHISSQLHDCMKETPY